MEKIVYQFSSIISKSSNTLEYDKIHKNRNLDIPYKGKKDILQSETYLKLSSTSSMSTNNNQPSEDLEEFPSKQGIEHGIQIPKSIRINPLSREKTLANSTNSLKENSNETSEEREKIKATFLK